MHHTTRLRAVPADAALLREALADARRARMARRRPAPGGAVPVGAGDGRARAVAATVARSGDAMTAQDGTFDLGRVVARCATLMQIGSPAIQSFVTSVAAIEVDEDAATAVTVILRELVYTLETSAEAGSAIRLFLSIEAEGSELVVALACPEAVVTPVPTASAARALSNADRITRAAGGLLVRGVRDGMMVFGVVFGWEAADDG